MRYLFYRWDGGEAPSASLPEDLSVSMWRPAADGLPHGESRSGHNLLWWAIDRLGGFASHDFTEITIARNGHPIHQLIVTPKWYRFPDMAAADLQLGGLWTEPRARGQGLARAAVAEVHRRFAGRFGRMWYIVERNNAASIRMIEACGYRLVGEGVRTRPLGIGLLGRFRITRSGSATGD